MNLRVKTFKNSVWNVTGFIYPLILFLITTPYYEKKLGPDHFGLLLLVLAIVGYFSVLDIGISSAVVKYLSEFIAKKDDVMIQKIINGSFLIYVVFSFLLAILLFSISDVLVDKILKIRQDEGIAKIIFYITSLAFAFKMLSNVFIAFIKARQRYDIVNLIGIIISSVNLIGGVFLLYLNFGIVDLIVLYLLLSIIQLFLLIRTFHRILSRFRLSLSTDRYILKMLFEFSWPSFISIMSGVLLFQFDKVLVGAIIGMAAVTYYTIPAELSIKIHSLVLSFLDIIFPLSSQFVGENDSARLQYLYFKGCKLMAVIATACFVPLLAFSDFIISAWMGEDFGRKTAIVFPVLLISYYLVSYTIVPYLMLNGMNKPRVNAFYSLLSFALNLSACIILIPNFGINGAAIATLVGIIQVPFYIWTFHKINKFSFSRLLKESFLKTWFVGVVQYICIKVCFSTFIVDKSSLLLILAISFIFFPALFILFRFYDKDDKDIFSMIMASSPLPRFRKIT